MNTVGDTGATGATGPIAVFPPLTTEVTVASVTQSVTAGDNLKIDYAYALNMVATANWSWQFESRLYRDGTLINTRTFNRSGSPAGTQRFPLSNTYVDTAPATSAASTYEIRVIFTAATNITSAATGNNININNITFA